MDRQEIKNSRGKSTIFYYSEFDIHVINERLRKYDIVIIDSIINSINKDLYNTVCAKGKRIIEIESGEETKRIDNVFAILKQIDSMNIYPINCALVVGGGTIQDLAGTCLGLIKRGVSWDFLPTSILAQCDSCIGSKTSINSFNSKNLYGLFYAPETIHVINSIALSQDEVELMSGFGDALHYLFLEPEKEYDYVRSILLKILNKGIRDFFQEDCSVIKLSRNCHAIKKFYIETDEFDKYHRKNLNLGHSFGHAIEQLFSYRIPHGIAVMHGIYMAYYFHTFVEKASIGESSTKLDKMISILLKVLEKHTEFAPIEIQNKIVSDIDTFISILKKDKKNINDSYTLVLLSVKPYLRAFSKPQLSELIPKVLLSLSSI